MRKWIAAGASVAFASALVLLPVPSAHAGAAGGPKIDRFTVPSRSVVRYAVTFSAGESARVWAVGQGDLDIEVYDENGALIACDDDEDGQPVVAFMPQSAGPFTIRVINNEHRSVDYVVRTN
jgi:hypothetical protein